MLNRRSISFSVLLLFLVVFSLPLMSQPGSGEVGPQLPIISQTETSVDKSLASIVVKAEALRANSAALSAVIAEIRDIKKLSENLTGVKAQLLDLKSRLENIKSSKSYGFEQVAQLRSDNRALLEVIGQESRSVSEKIEQAGSLRQTWRAKETSWADSRSALTGEAGTSVASIFKEAEKILQLAFKSMEDIEVPLVDFQQKVFELQREAQVLGTGVDKLLLDMRKDLFLKSRPAMFTPTFLRQFNSATWDEFWLGLATLELPSAKFYSTYGWIFVLQLIIFILAIYFFKTLKNHKIEQLKLDFILERYISASLLLGILLPLPLFEEKPRLVSLILAGIIAVSAARLVAGIIERSWRRRLIYMIVSLYLLVQFFNFISLPATLLRTFIAVVGLAGAVFCHWRARANKDDSGSFLFNIGIKVVGITMLLIFLTQVSGYIAMSSHLLDILIKSVFLGLIAWMIDLIARGALELLFDNETLRKNKIIDQYRHLFIKRGHLIVDLIVVFMAFANLLSVWGFFDNARHAAEGLLTIGFSLQETRISSGLLLSAIVALYLALFASWLIQVILNEEVYPRKKIDRGVGISINHLIQYAFVLVGIAMAFSALGIGMQNLTVVLGALGVGIGFGLQNIVNNFASGLILLFERSIKVGDVVQVKGEWGVIKNLGLRATVVETFDRSEMIVPNSDLVASTVTNWTLTDRQVRVVVSVGVAYGSDIDLVTRLLEQAAQDNPAVMQFPAPSVIFANFGASSLDFDLRCWVANIDVRATTKSQLNRAIDRLFRENNIEIPFSQHDLHIRSMDKPFKAALAELTASESGTRSEAEKSK